MILCRLARAQMGAGQMHDARETAKEIVARLDSGGPVSPKDAPEIYFTLHQVHAEDTRGGSFLSKAREMVEERAQHVRNDAHREYFLTRSWPNADILDAARAP